MLSYMLPAGDKGEKGALQLELGPRPARSIISKESSVSSFAGSDGTASSLTPTGQDKPKPKLLSNGTKHTTLKRVSFGSSKGSMVETLIYESPLQEEPEVASPPPGLHDAPFPFPEDILEQEESERSKVRVSFFQSVRAQTVAEPPAESPAPPQPAAMASPDRAAPYTRQESTESGWDNPFRPDGDLSREADEIVSLIRWGKPITPTPNSANTPLLPSLDETDTQVANNTGVATPITQSPVKALNSAPLESKNGASNGAEPRTVELQRSPEPMQPEHVLIKKKPKCKCCVIQ